LWRPGPSQSPELVVLGLLSLAGYGGAGLKLLHECFLRFQVEVDRPRRAERARVGPGAEGVQFVEEEQPDPSEITFLEPDDAGPRREDPGET
jgi:hypothetical protein